VAVLALSSSREGCHTFTSSTVTLGRGMDLILIIHLLVYYFAIY